MKNWFIDTYYQLKNLVLSRHYDECTRYLQMGIKHGRRHALAKAIGYIPDGFFDENENTYYTGTGQILAGCHQWEEACEDGCVIHKQLDHPMKGQRTHWRGDRQMMERICRHGIGHPDPFQVKYWQRTLTPEQVAVEMVHGCCGDKECCTLYEGEA